MSRTRSHKRNNRKTAQINTDPAIVHCEGVAEEVQISTLISELTIISNYMSEVMNRDEYNKENEPKYTRYVDFESYKCDVELQETLDTRLKKQEEALEKQREQTEVEKQKSLAIGITRDWWKKAEKNISIVIHKKKEKAKKKMENSAVRKVFTNALLAVQKYTYFRF